jgi:hypothetical protein
MIVQRAVTDDGGTVHTPNLARTDEALVPCIDAKSIMKIEQQRMEPKGRGTHRLDFSLHLVFAASNAA